MSSDILPRRFGLKYDPPTIILEYRRPSKNKLYLHIMPVDELEPSHDPYDWLEILLKEHPAYLDPKIIEERQILSLIAKLQESMISDSQDNSEDDDEDWAF